MLETRSMSVVVPNPHARATPGDQAAGLRSLFARRALRILPVLPAGDPAGQGCCAALLAREIAATGRQVILLDETGACARPLGVKARHDLLTLIEGEQEFEGVAVRAAPNLRYVAAGEGLPVLINADAAGEQFFHGFLNLNEPADTLVLNLAGTPSPQGAMWLPGLAASAPHLLVAGIADADLTGAYAAIKQAYSGARVPPAFRLLVSGAASERAARQVAAKIAEAARRFLNAQVEYAGFVPPNAAGTPLGRGLQANAYPEAVQSINRLGRESASWPLAECVADTESSHPN
jgi:MinD-like ATPase involved in chromosome partitioning or flagellar assembly